MVVSSLNLPGYKYVIDVILLSLNGDCLRRLKLDSRRQLPDKVSENS